MAFTWKNIIEGTVTDPDPINQMGQQVQALVNPQRASTSIPSSSAAIGTSDTEIMRISGFTFKDTRAYRCVIGGGIVSAGGNEGNMSIYKTSIAGGVGNRLTEYYRYPSSTVVRNCDGTRYLKNVTGADITLDVILALAANTGTVTAFATAGTAFSFTIEECGNAADYSYAFGISP